MSNYRPICDIWLMARAKLRDGEKFYGAYLGGFPERARALLGVRLTDPVLHVCGGKAKLYPYRRAFGPNDKTLDLDPSLEPDFLQDARDPYPTGFRACLCDPPYSEIDAEKYVPGAKAYPPPGLILRNGLAAVGPGGRVGIIHYALPKPPPDAIFVALIGVGCGFGNRLRAYTVFENPT